MNHNKTSFADLSAIPGILVDSIISNCLKRKKPDDKLIKQPSSPYIDNKIDIFIPQKKIKKDKLVLSHTPNIETNTNTILKPKQTFFTNRNYIKINNKLIENKEIDMIKNTIKLFDNCYIDINVPLNTEENQNKINLTFHQYSYIQHKIENYVAKDDLIPIIQIIKCIGIYYLENDMCIVASKNKSFKCIKWFILNKIYVDKFACEEAIKNNDLNMLTIVSENLGKDSLNSPLDLEQFYIMGLVNNSIECLDYVFAKWNLNIKKIPSKIIKFDNIGYLKCFYNNNFFLDDDDILIACKYGCINTLKFAHSKNFKFNEKMLNLTINYKNTECSTFIKLIINKTDNFTKYSYDFFN